jgi:hypothetical protein
VETFRNLFGDVDVSSSEEEQEGPSPAAAAAAKAALPPQTSPDRTIIKANILPVFEVARKNYCAIKNDIEEGHRRELRAILNHLCDFLACNELRLTNKKDKLT